MDAKPLWEIIFLNEMKNGDVTHANLFGFQLIWCMPWHKTFGMSEWYVETCMNEWDFLKAHDFYSFISPPKLHEMT